MGSNDAGEVEDPCRELRRCGFLSHALTCSGVAAVHARIPPCRRARDAAQDDLGHCFDLYATFGGSRDYRPFPKTSRSRLFLVELARGLEAEDHDPERSESCSYVLV